MWSARRARGQTSGGQFATRSRAEGDAVMGNTVTLIDRDGQIITLRTNEFGAAAEHIFTNGQCAAFAAALVNEFDGAIITTAIAHDSVLVHAWVQYDKQVFDALHYFEPEDEIHDRIAEEWGTHSVKLKEWTGDELLGWLSTTDTVNPQDLAAAQQMIPAYLARHRG